MKAIRHITDTTLLNFAGFMPPKERVEWAGMLDAIGVHEIVMPLCSRRELAACAQVIHTAKQAVYVRMETAQLSKALRMGVTAVFLEIPISYPMIYTNYRKNKDWARKTLLECGELLANTDVVTTLVLADASRAEPCFLESLVQLTAGMRVDKIVAKDLMGIQTLSACAELIGLMLTFGYDLGYEGNDRFGLSVANTIQALRMGALYAGCCLGGLGGGCDLRRLLQTTNRVFDYGINRKGAEQLDRTFKQQYRSERMLRRQDSRNADSCFPG
ncbi:MAG TPA: hypothetical protein PK537_09905 [Candidatus Limiplasma sp.]|nr:hypothetical protein [Candidatus Limiplasma sp.]